MKEDTVVGIVVVVAAFVVGAASAAGNNASCLLRAQLLGSGEYGRPPSSTGRLVVPAPPVVGGEGRTG